MSGSGATIVDIALTPTHDAEAAMLVVLEFPNGGRSRVQMSNAEAVEVVRRAGLASPEELVGQPWTVLQVRPISFARI